MTRRIRGRWSCEEINDDEILRRINVLYRDASLSLLHHTDVGEGAYRPNRPEPSPVTATRVFAGMSYCINNSCTTVSISSDPLLPLAMFLGIARTRCTKTPVQ